MVLWCVDSVEREGGVCKREKGKSHALRALSLPILESSFSTSKKQVLLFHDKPLFSWLNQERRGSSCSILNGIFLDGLGEGRKVDH